MAEEENKEQDVVEKVDEGTVDYKKKLIVFLVVIVTLFCFIIGAVIYLFWGGEDQEGAVAKSRFEREFLESSQREIVKLKNPIFVHTQLYSVNLKEGKHYLRLSSVMVFQDPMLEPFLTSRMPVIDDLIISILKKETVENLRTRSGLDLLKREIYRQISHLVLEEFVPTALNKDRTPLKDVLITRFVLN